MKRLLILFTALAAGMAARGYTNVLDEGESQTVTNAYDAGASMTIGESTPSNSLSIVNGGTVTNVNGYVGREAGASSNTVTVSGTGSEWINSGTLTIGAAGNTNNSVSVSSGGSVKAADLVIDSSSGFYLNNGGTLVLADSFDASLEGFNWNAGGTLSVGGLLTGMATTNEGTILSGEKTLVLNGGSLDIATDLIIGYESSDNLLAITNGGTVENANGYIGWGTNASDNAVLVSGNGSAWTNTGNLYIGVYGDPANLMTAGAGNSLTVSNGAWVYVGGADTNLTALGSGGIAIADGSELVVGSNSSAWAEGVYIGTSGSLDLDGALTVGGDFDADQTGFHWNNGGELAVQGELTYNSDLSGENQTLSIVGGSWDRGDNLQISGSGNRLEILNGGGVTNLNGLVGVQTGESNNTVLVSGDGSVWMNNGDLSIGNTNANSGNSVTVADGGRVQADSLFVGADDAFYLNNGGTLAITGDFDLSTQTGLNWNPSGNLSIGGALSGITNLASGRMLTLDGPDAEWLLPSEDMSIADVSTLIVTNGAIVSSANLSVTGDAYASVASDTWLLVGDAADTNDLVQGGVVVASTNGAMLTVDDGGSLTIAETLLVGKNDSESGSITVTNGGTITAGELLINGTNSVFGLGDGGTLAITEGTFNASMDGFEWSDGGTLSIGGDLTGLDTFSGTNRTLVIADGSWDTTATNLYISGVSNTLAITEGGQVDSASAYIGATSNDVGNVVSVSGSGSVWNVAGNLFINPDNTLALASTGLVSVAGNVVVSNASVTGSGLIALGDADSVLSVYGTNSQISSGVLFDGAGGTAEFIENELIVDGSLSNRFVDFSTLSMTDSTLGGSGVVDGFPTIEMTGGRIALTGDLTIEGAFSASDTILQVSAGTNSLRVTDSVLDLGGLLAEVTVSTNESPVDFNEVILVADMGFGGSEFASTNFIEGFLLYEFSLTNETANSISVVSEAIGDGELGATTDYAGIQGVRAGFNGMQNAMFVRTRQLRRNTAATDHAISQRAAEFKANAAPEGALGPGDDNTIFGMHFWTEQFSGQGNYDALAGSEGFDLNNNGSTFGFDRLVGDSLALGINYTYARSDASTTAGDRVETETYWLGLYGDWISADEYYLEGLIALGQSDYNTRRAAPGYTGIAKFSGTDFGAHIEGGKYFHRKGWAMAPYAGLQYLGIKSDDYTETAEQGGNQAYVSGQDVASLESALGIKLRNRFDTRAGRFQTAGYAEWAYDFINDDIGSSIADGTISVQTARVTPGASLLNAGIGLSWICTDYLEVGVGYDGRFNENYEEHLGTIMLDVRF